MVFKNGELLFQNKKINNLNSTIVFDFNRVEVREFQANIGSKGVINSQGGIALFNSKFVEENRTVRIGRLRRHRAVDQ